MPSASSTDIATSTLRGPHTASKTSSATGFKRGHSKGGRNLSQVLSDLPLPWLFTSHPRLSPSEPSSTGDETDEAMSPRKRLVRKVTRKGSLRNGQTSLKRDQPGPDRPSTSSAHNPSPQPSQPARSRPMSTLLWEYPDETFDEDVAPSPVDLENIKCARLAKLRRHLGEEIPPSLISAPPTSTRRQYSQDNPRETSDGNLTVGPREGPTSPPNITYNAESSTGIESTSSHGRSKSLRSKVTQPRGQLTAARRPSLDFETKEGQSELKGPPLATELLPANVQATSSSAVPRPEGANAPARLQANSIAPVSGTPSVEISSRTRGALSGPARRPILPRRPTTAESTSSESYVARARRERKLAKFFGIEDANGLKLLSSAGTLAVQPADLDSQTTFEFDQPSRFWHFVDGRGVVKQANTEDVMTQLRTMRAR